MARRRGRRDPPKLRVALSLQGAAGPHRQGRPARSAARPRRSPTCCARSATRSSSATPTTASAALRWSARWYRAASHDDAARDAAPRAARAADEGRWRASAAPSGRAACAGRSRREAADAARINAIFDDVDVVLGPGHGDAAAGRRALDRARASCGRSTASARSVPVPGGLEPPRQPGDHRPLRRRAGRAAAVGADGRAAATARRRCWRSPRRSSARGRGPTGARRWPRERRAARRSRWRPPGSPARCWPSASATEVAVVREVDADRPRVRGRPRGRGGDPRRCSPRGARTTSCWGRRRAATVAPLEPGRAALGLRPARRDDQLPVRHPAVVRQRRVRGRRRRARRRDLRPDARRAVHGDARRRPARSTAMPVGPSRAAAARRSRSS